MKILSLGWGVQSFTLAAMVALGELEPIDYAIHADTTHESQRTYEFVNRWKWWLHDKGVKIVTVTHENRDRIDPFIFSQRKQVFIPAFTNDIKGNHGQLLRQCSKDWKINVMRRHIQKTRNGERVEQWLGISLDEFKRMKDSDVGYITNRFPLIEKKMTRIDCEKWLTEKGIEIPAKSACTFCPYRDTEQWRLIKSNKKDWEEATAVDRVLRNARPDMSTYIHPSRKPLTEVDFSTSEEQGQLSLWDNECEGICGV